MHALHGEINEVFMRSGIIRKIICLSLSLMAVLMVVRARILGLKFVGLNIEFEKIQNLILSNFYDWLFVVIMSAFFILLTILVRKNNTASRVVFGGFIAATVFCVLISLLNIIAVHMLNGPLNYQWIYYSDFFANSEARKGFLTFLSWPLWNNFFILSFVVLAGGFSMYYLIFGRGFIKFSTWQTIAFGVVLVLYFVVSADFANRNKKSYNKLANPIVSLASSILVSFKDPGELFAEGIPEHVLKEPTCRSIRKFRNNIPGLKIQNIILFVMESVPAEYVSGYSSKYSATPNIGKHLSHSIVFSDIYAHFPATNSSLVSLLTSMYPMISYKSISKEFPEINWPSIPSELKKANYSTAFFHASDNRFQGMDKFLSARKFDKICDYQNIQCSKNILVGSTPTWKYLDGIEEDCMMDAFMDWLPKKNHEKPFFAMLWTIQTHHPYYFKGKEILYEKKNANLNRYLNALHHSDYLLGKLLDELKTRGMMDETLVIVVGDHGEAFGRHDQIGHGSQIYEENVKVPLIFINPQLTREKISVVGGQIDLAPTLMDILNRPSPKEWQGLSLFDTNRINRAYFFNPHTYYLFGYREGKYKVIYNANWNETMIFDLSIDPEEMHNIGDTMPEMSEQSTILLGAWVRNQSAVLNKKIHIKN